MIATSNNYVNPWTSVPNFLPKPVDVATINIVSSIMPPDKSSTMQSSRDSKWLWHNMNIRYSDPDKGIPDLLRVEKRLRFNNYAAKSKFFTNTNDGEKKEQKMYEASYKTNPSFIMDKKNVKELEAEVQDVNSLNKTVMEDNGAATFIYDAGTTDQVGIVKSSNKAYAERRDRFFTPEQPRQEELADLKKKRENLGFAFPPNSISSANSGL